MRLAARRGMCSLPGVASRRGREAPTLLPTYLSDARGVETYDAELRPDGVLQLSVAENQMISDWLVPKIRSISATPASPAHGGGAGLFEQGDIFYQQTHGTARCRAAVAAHMERVLCRGSYAIDPDKLIVGAGCNAVLENLLFAIADEGEGVLIPRPYYAAFEFDLKARAALTILPVALRRGSSEAAGYCPTPDALEAAYSAAVRRGITPRALLLSSPNNPLGICYPAEALRDAWAWAESKPNLHVISDEIYAGSVYREGAHGQPGWVSLATVAARLHRSLGPNAHLVWALSKDFALSGLRVGAVYTENEAIRTPMQKLNDLCQVSSPTQAIVARMLSDTLAAEPSPDPSYDEQLEGPAEPVLWCAALEESNKERLRRRYDRLTAVLDGGGIRYLPGGAGLFLWIDLRPMLQYAPGQAPVARQSWDGCVGVAESMLSAAEAEAERALYLRLITEFGLMLTPGASMRAEDPGMFRCVFSAATDDGFEVALDRFAKLGQAAKAC